MTPRLDAKMAAYQVTGEGSAAYALQIASGTMAYLDVPPGYYQCFVPGYPAEHVRLAILDMPNPAAPPTLLPAALPAPTPATAGVGNPPRLASNLPAGALGSGMVPTDKAFMLHVPAGRRLAVLYNAAGPVTMYATQVL